MLYRKFGKTNEQVSALGFGCMRLPVFNAKEPSKIDEKEAIRLIRYAIDNGVNYIDTAYPYHGTGFDKPGESEPLVAKALRDGYRAKVKLATKLPSWLITCYQDMEKYLDKQLARLDTDCIDFYLIHTLNNVNWPNLVKNNVEKFLEKAKADGKIKYAGFSFHDDKVLFKKIVDAYDWDFCQIQYNFLDENYQAGREGLEYAVKKGLGITVMEPLRGGNLSAEPPEAIAKVWSKSDVKRSPSEWALKWLFNNPEISVVLSGMSAMEHVVENLKVASETLPNSLATKDIELIDEVKHIYKSRIMVDCTNCQYCMPCPVGVNIPKNFSSYNNYFLFDSKASQETAGRMYQMVVSASERPENCIECGKCEQHCPQNIKIISELKKVKELFDI